jgi:hypothetical protein
MDRVYAPFGEWEDYHAGLYAEPGMTADQDRVWAQRLLSDPPALYAAMRWVVEAWETACAVVFTSPMNHRAWLGQSAACIAGQVPAKTTKEAWWLLSETQQHNANAVADAVILEWRSARCRNANSE